MADVFISYERSAEPVMQRATRALAEAGHQVWSDAELPSHRAYAEVIEERLAAAEAVLVLWSANATRSQWVRAEAEFARERGRLVQATLDGTLPPMPFNQIQCASLTDWSGDAAAPGWRKVLVSIAALTGAEGSGPTPRAAIAPRTLARRPHWRRWALVAAAVLAAIGAIVWYRSAGPHRVARIAVLPITVAGGGGDTRAFATALGDQISFGLSGSDIPALSRDDARALTGSDRDARLKAMGVTLLFGGSVTGDGKTLTIQTHIDDPAQHVTIWSNTDHGEVATANALRARVTQTVVSVLSCSRRALKENGLSDPQVLGRYLHACDLFVNHDDASGTASTFDLLDTLRKVIADAPRFVAAHTDLAKFSAYLAPLMPADQAAAMRAEAASEAKLALSLDPNVPDAYLAQEMLLPPTDWAAREALLRKGVSVDPAWPHTNGFLGMLLSETGRVADGLVSIDHAAAADLQIDWRPAAATFRCNAGQGDAAIADLRERLTTQPGDPALVYALDRCLIIAGRYAEEERLRHDPPPEVLGTPIELGKVSAALSKAKLSGRPADAEDARRIAIARATSNDSPDQLISSIQVLAVLGDLDDAFALAQRYRPGYPMTGIADWLFAVPTASMRRDRRFMPLVARYGLVDFWRASGKWPDFCSEPGLPYNCRAEAAKLAGTR